MKPCLKSKEDTCNPFPLPALRVVVQTAGHSELSNVLNNAAGQDELFSCSGTLWILSGNSLKLLCGFHLQTPNKEKKPAWRVECLCPGSLWRAPSAGSVGGFCSCLPLFTLLGCTNALPLSKFITGLFLFISTAGMD